VVDLRPEGLWAEGDEWVRRRTSSSANTSADQAWAEWIAWQLEADGYQVVIQAWDFTPGHDWAHEMQEATTKAERIVAVLPAAYLRSAHGEAEWRVFYAEDPSGERGLLLPVRVARRTRRGC
jgi:TIR domain